MPMVVPNAPILITCTATTVTGMPVKVVGMASAAGAEDPRELYVITVDGHEVVRERLPGARLQPNRVIASA